LAFGVLVVLEIELKASSSLGKLSII
jgi:hypothetical protein